MINVIRHGALFSLLALFYTGGLAGQVQPFTVEPADPVINPSVTAPTVEIADVRLSKLPEGCTDPGGGILPISTPELLATRLDPARVSLRWKTFDDDFTNRWILQRRTESSNNFTDFWELAENTFLRGDRVDYNDYVGISYYRLYGISPEGEEVYSPVVAVGNARGINQLLVYPNPVHAAASVRLPGVSASARLSLVDGLGRVVWQRVHPEGGANTLRIPFLQPGAYLLKWEDASGQAAVTRFVKTGH